MSQWDYVHEDVWFAWYPVRLTNDKLIWWKKVKRTTDNRPVQYEGLFPIVTYEEISN